MTSEQTPFIGENVTIGLKASDGYLDPLISFIRVIGSFTFFVSKTKIEHPIHNYLN